MPHAEVEKFPENAFIIIQTATFHNSKQKLSELLAEHLVKTSFSCKTASLDTKTYKITPISSCMSTPSRQNTQSHSVQSALPYLVREVAPCSGALKPSVVLL